ncbi:carbohydrate porin [Phormidium sp. FACHB-592]|uniref:Iron uptake porin n=1 Tax=Stenomitos frigidus AS-A4 TaxID=2933935 RepID=A0ABV0KVY4_9CYAN|nr:iron uptake porin [Phormidium sp. FACHB-592]MBD2076759.1 carbohydrate porin [Phormidium sp. FACHB-592]
MNAFSRTIAVVGTAMFLSGQPILTMAATPAQLESETLHQNTVPVSPTQPQAIAVDLSLDSSEAAAIDGMEQVTSISQLTDVELSDWAFQALQSLVERYGCIVGYPDKTFLGNRALTRYEFAAGLKSCVDRIDELLTSSTADLVKKEDLLALQRLQEEFAAELATIGGRVEALGTRTATLEKQQFSPTTKLNGLAWFNLTGAFAGGDVRFEALPNTPVDARFVGGRDATGRPLVQTTDRAEPTLSALTWLTLNTSFTGKDTLAVQLAAGNGISSINQFVSAGFFATYGNPYTDQTPGTVPGRSDVVIQDLYYSFPLTDAIKLTVGPRINWFSYFDFNRFTFFLTGASSYASISSTQTSATFWGSGAVLEWNINPKWRFAAAYLGESVPYLPASFGYNTASNPSAGLFGGTYAATAELTYSPTDQLNLRFRYNYTRLQAYGGQVGGSNAVPLPYGYVDAGPGSSIFDPITGSVTSGGLDYAIAHTFAFNLDWLITPGFGVFGRYSYGNTNLKPIDQAVNVQSFQVGVAFPDLGKKGALGAITFVAPMDIVNGRQYFVAGGGNGGTIYELEASYYYPLNDRLAIVPAFYAIFNANNFDSNPNLYVGNLRAQFSF